MDKDSSEIQDIVIDLNPQRRKQNREVEAKTQEEAHNDNDNNDNNVTDIKNENEIEFVQDNVNNNASLGVSDNDDGESQSVLSELSGRTDTKSRSQSPSGSHSPSRSGSRPGSRSPSQSQPERRRTQGSRSHGDSGSRSRSQSEQSEQSRTPTGTHNESYYSADGTQQSHPGSRSHTPSDTHSRTDPGSESEETHGSDVGSGTDDDDEYDDDEVPIPDSQGSSQSESTFESHISQEYLPFYIVNYPFSTVNERKMFFDLKYDSILKEFASKGIKIPQLVEKEKKKRKEQERLRKKRAKAQAKAKAKQIEMELETEKAKHETNLTKTKHQMKEPLLSGGELSDHDDGTDYHSTLDIGRIDPVMKDRTNNKDADKENGDTQDTTTDTETDSVMQNGGSINGNKFNFKFYLRLTSHNGHKMSDEFGNGNRVNALKYAIQTSRLLIDETVLSEPQFYPAIFACCAKVLDEFGFLVFRRMNNVAAYGHDNQALIDKIVASNKKFEASGGGSSSSSSSSGGEEKVDSDDDDYKNVNINGNSDGNARRNFLAPESSDAHIKWNMQTQGPNTRLIAIGDSLPMVNQLLQSNNSEGSRFVMSENDNTNVVNSASNVEIAIGNNNKENDNTSNVNNKMQVLTTKQAIKYDELKEDSDDSNGKNENNKKKSFSNNESVNASNEASDGVLSNDEKERMKRKSSIKDKMKTKFENRRKQKLQESELTSVKNVKSVKSVKKAKARRQKWKNKSKSKNKNKNKERRRKRRRNKKERRLPINFLFSHISPIVQIKTRNWFLKIAAIRELVPRLMIEICLFGCLRYIYSLSEMFNYAILFIKRLRGISNPLIACYCRIFTFQQMFQVFGNFLHENKINMIENVYFIMFKDMLRYFDTMIDNQFKYVPIVYNGIMDSQDYLNIFNAAFDIIFECIMYEAKKQYRRSLKAPQSSDNNDNNHIDIQDIPNTVELYLRDKIDKSLLDLIDLKAFLNCSSG